MLIVCEGRKTEPTYFDGIRKQKRLSAVQVRVVPSRVGSHPKRVVEYARELSQQARRGGLPYAIVWCVFDRDRHERIDEAFVQARDNEFRIAFSNPSFELWYLLHFERQGAHIQRGEAVRRLKSHIPKYTKSLDIYGILLAHQATAMQWASDLRSQQHGITADACVEESPNPSTWVDTLVRYLDGL